MRLIGHRGLSHNIPENTLQAFKACCDSKIGMECDIQLTKDRHVIVLHDKTLERTAKGCIGDWAEGEYEKFIDTDVNHLLWSDIKKVNVGSNAIPEPTPLLEEVLQLYLDYGCQYDLFIEIGGNNGKDKKNDYAILRPLVKVLDKFIMYYRFYDNIHLISYGLEVLSAIQNDIFLSNFKKHWIINSKKIKNLDYFVKMAKIEKITGFTIKSRKSRKMAKIIKELLANDFIIGMWTNGKINEYRHLQYAAKLNCHFYTANGDFNITYVGDVIWN